MKKGKTGGGLMIDDIFFKSCDYLNFSLNRGSFFFLFFLPRMHAKVRSLLERRKKKVKSDEWRAGLQ